MSEQYAALLTEKQERYAGYQADQQDMITYRTAKSNVDKILGAEVAEQDAKTQWQEADRRIRRFGIFKRISRNALSVCHREFP